MATLEIDENCHCVQNDPHKCKIKLKKFHFDISCCFGVIKENLPGAESTLPPPPGKIGLNGLIKETTCDVMVAHLQSHAMPWHQYARHMQVHGTSLKMDVWLAFKERLCNTMKTESCHGKILLLAM